VADPPISNTRNSYVPVGKSHQWPKVQPPKSTG
jgi:hypothetical protein